ncbi:ABC transporter ATP-binding protein [Blautia sp. Marseille-P3201T]|jgi:putative ABC transport system ATP-binding protein|uniref:ABC transporter ATP-binding protein n=1 Tax=Blautia sp. Marseille-P3201T TaxID=1907659 RepID=UPI0009307C4B|nr:ABC transporter ATP-binding protein [Blautia sp. Marseille-P3201T]
MAIKTVDLCKIYESGEKEIKALNNVNVEIKKGELVAIIGKSGSGKTTLLNMIGGLDTPTSGEIYIGEKEISRLSDDELTESRRNRIGFIFQNYNLIPVLNVYENITFPVQLDGRKPDDNYIEDMLKVLEISSKKTALPSSLSGGQQQRVAIARALVNHPEIVLADEPTGNLDMAMGNEVIKFLKKMNELYNQTIVIVTHDQDIAAQMDRIITIADGSVINDKEVCIKNSSKK